MKCPKCGAILEEDSKFCVSCGTQLEIAGGTSYDNPDTIMPQNRNNYENATTPAAERPRGPKKRKINVLGVIVGTFIILIGIIRISSAGTSISSTSFGGDFYTYTYRGIVAISEILASIEVSLGWIIVSIGAAIDVVSLRK